MQKTAYPSILFSACLGPMLSMLLHILGEACYISLKVHWLFASPESSSVRFQLCHHVFVSERILANRRATNYQWRNQEDMVE